MNLTALYIVVGMLTLLAVGAFLVYGYLAVRHATRFRYLSRRMLLLTLFFISSSALLIGLIVMSYCFFILKYSPAA